MPEPKELIEARQNLAKQLLVFDFYPTIKRAEELKVDKEKLWAEKGNEAYLRWANIILSLKGKGWKLAIVSPRGRNRRIIWEADSE